MLRLRDDAGGVTALVPDHAVFHVTLDVEVHFGDRVDVYRGLELDPSTRNTSRQFCTTPSRPTRTASYGSTTPNQAPRGALRPRPERQRFWPHWSHPVSRASSSWAGQTGTSCRLAPLTARPEAPTGRSPATGLEALGEIDDIAIVAMPDSTYFQDAERAVRRWTT